MVKSNQPLQIRLTEPVVFLRGPTTGLDHRGRPTGIDSNAAPAMLRGLLTLRLNKATRIRSITVKLDGKSRTEWPEGIGPRRLDTFEEHQIIEESTTFFDARRRSSRSQSTRRATSVGPGVYAPPSELSSEEIDDDLDLVDIPGESGEDWTAINRGRDRGRGLPRSASALPGIHDAHTWHRDGFSRRNSVEQSDPERSRPASNEFVTLRDLRNGEGERGPSPAYTPMASTTQLSSTLNTTSNARGDFRESVLSPIQSAVPSRAASDRDDSTDTQQRYPMERRQSSLPSEEVRERGEEAESPGTMEEDQHHAIRSILSSGALQRNRPSMGGEVRFAQPQEVDGANDAHEEETVGDADTTEGEVGAGRSTSTASYHPHAAAIHAISAASTAHNSPAPSRPASLHPRNSLDNPAGPVPTAPPALSSPRNSISRLPIADPGPSASAASSRPSSIFRSPAESSTASLTETRQGKKNRLGSHSTIVINNDPTVPPILPDETPAAGNSLPPVAGPSVSPDRARARPSSLAPQAKHEDNDRRRGRFSLAATLRGISQDVKDRVRQSSKSRTRQPSIPRQANGSHTDIPVPPIPPSHRSSLSAQTDDFNPSRPRSTSRQVSSSSTQIPNDSMNGGNPRNPSLRRGSFTFAQDPDFVPPGGSRGGAARINQSRERRRTESPAPARSDGKRGGRSPSRSRGRNKGMKVLTDALGLGDGRPEGEEEGEDLHNWKEFRKGTYNYPISFPIPVSTPPTVHAEFGSVSYRLKATVVRVGALSPNLIEEVEVMMIATPQEDDLEESENVIVERQWEEQMRYQIALSGKAFPIGGIIPLSVRIMPLLKCKIHRLSCVLEEKTDYFAQGRKVVRHETPRRFTLLFVKQTDQRPPLPPLLPIISDDPLAARSSPLAPLALAAALNNPSAFTNFAGEHDEDALYAGMMDPMGPWHLEQELQIPDCAARVRFTTKHEKTNTAVGHWLKVTIRVERGDDEALDSKGKRKQFDIIIETPIKILDCRVNPQWNSLPTYSTSSPSSTAALGGLCSIHGTRSTAASLQSSLPIPTARTASSGTSTSRIDGLTPHPPPPSTVRRREEGDDSLLERNIVFDRLMSGQETEAGDVPPTYGEVLAEGKGEGRRVSASPAGLDRVRGERGDSTSRSRSRLRQEM